MTRKVKRLDGVSEVVTKPVEVSRLVQPKFLTLTKMPAGQVAFKVVRDDQTEESEMTTAKTPAAPVEAVRHRRIRSTTRSALLYIEFPAGTTPEEVQSAIEEYGIDGYEIVQEGDKICLRRSDLTETPGDALTVFIGGGRKAGVLRSEVVATQTTDPMPFVSVIAIDFKSDVFATQEAVLDYLQRHDIDFLEKGVENVDNVIRVSRSVAPPDTEIRRVEVEAGVVALVTRAAVADLVNSTPFIEVVSETAYGRWGWGQLDFTASMADREFCEVAEDATNTLRKVVEDILFYSQLPVSARKELVSRAAAQFASYIGSLLDALPAKVVLINRSNLENIKESQMTSKTVPTAGAKVEPIARTDGALQPTPADGTVTVPAAAPVAAALSPTDTITRSEAQTMIDAAVTAALAAVGKPVATEPVVRTDEASATAPATTQANDMARVVEEAVTRSVGAFAKAVESVNARLEAIEGATTVRSDSGDGVTTAPKDPFVGVFSQNMKSK